MIFAFGLASILFLAGLFRLAVRGAPEEKGFLRQTDFYKSRLADLDDQVRKVAEKDAKNLLRRERAQIARYFLKMRENSGALAAADSSPDDSSLRDRRGRHIWIIFALVPLFVFPLYYSIGAPFFDPSLALERQADNRQGAADFELQSLEELLLETEEILRRRPNDSKGWNLLARIYDSLGRFDDRDRARAQLARIEAEKAAAGAAAADEQ